MKTQRPLILASQSPRRRELLQLCGCTFRVTSADVDEEAIAREMLAGHKAGEDFLALVTVLVGRLAEAKAAAAAESLGNAAESVILSSDTVVVLGEKVLGKPRDEAEARYMLRRLAGQEHRVLTGVCIRADGRSEVFASEAAVRFYPADAFMEHLIDHYVETGSPLDKAGAYGIQDEGALLVEAIHGDFYTVMGLPVAETARRLQKYLYA